MGHQGAIYQGLLYARNISSNKFIVIDADGEDDPHAIIELSSYNNYDIVWVARGRRKEKPWFIIAYLLYQWLFKLVTNKRMDFGNYCLINKEVLETTVYTTFIHFAAHLSKLKTKSFYIVYDRRKRNDGKSKYLI